MTDLKDRLSKLGFSPASKVSPQVKNKAETLEDIVGGLKIVNNQGEVIKIERIYPYGYQYGNVNLQPPEGNQEIIKFSKNFNNSSPIINHLFIDTETTGLSGGTGTYPFLIGFGYFDKDGFRTIQLLVENPIYEMSQLVEFSNSAQNFHTTVTFNGKSFDLPIIRTRYFLNQLENPLSEFSHIDLLHISRRIWKMRLTNHSLRELETQILGFQRSTDEVPGWMIPQIYFDYLRTGDGSQLKGVAYHNEIDVVSMAVLYTKINSILNLVDMKDYPSTIDIYSMAKMYARIGEFPKAVNLFDICVNSGDLSKDLVCDAHFSLAEIYKKDNMWETRLPHLIKCVELGSFEACIEISKYYEHKLKKPVDALLWSTKAEELINNSPLQRYKKLSILKNIQLRKSRLSKRKQNV
jgi:uncharacterized protein YprB with RNaseH-like and TPR domain